MSERSSETPDNGDWEKLSQILSEVVRKNNHLEDDLCDVDSGRTTSGLPSSENIVLRNQLEAERATSKALREEVALLRAQLRQNEMDFKACAWMQNEIQEVDKSIARMKESTKELYKKMIEVGKSIEVTKSREERKALAVEVQKMEDLCEQISSSIIKTNDNNIKAIERFLNKEENKEAPVEEKNEPLDSFLGTFELLRENCSQTNLPITISIERAASENVFDERLTYHNGLSTLRRRHMGFGQLECNGNRLKNVGNANSHLQLPASPSNLIDIQYYQNGFVPGNYVRCQKNVSGTARGPSI